MRRPVVAFLLSLLLSFAIAQRWDEGCSLDVENMTVEELINNAPSDWTFGCMTKRLITEAIGSKEHVKGIIDCLHPDYPICAKPGYTIIAEEIFRRADGGGRCRTCSPKTQALVDYALQLMQQRHPRELREGLSYLG